MPFVEDTGLRAFQFDLFRQAGLIHGIYARRGGVSPQPWASLNQGGTVGDERVNVIENRRRIFASVGRQVESIYDVWQVHSTTVICTQQPRPLDSPHEKADAILTDRPDITLFMRFADCVPILLWDPIRKVAGVVHAGWKGTVEGIASESIRTMQQYYGSRPADILAGIGPSICVEHYEVGQEVIERARQRFGTDAGQVLLSRDGRTAFDLWQANRLLLSRAGLNHDHIEIAGICTAGNQQDWFSHRGENGKTGRFGALIALNS
jgi:polyphenol oxidase